MYKLRGLKTRTVLGLSQPSVDLPTLDLERGTPMQTYIHGSPGCLVRLQQIRLNQGFGVRLCPLTRH